MSGAEAIQIVTSLRRGMAQLEAERDSALVQVRSDYDERIKIIEKALSAMGERGETLARSPLDQRPATMALLAVGEDKLERVRRDLLKHPRSRQADIVKRTKLNSGTVSVALRRLRIDAGIEGCQVEPTVKEEGSQVWELTQVPAMAA